MNIIFRLIYRFFWEIERLINFIRLKINNNNESCKYFYQGAGGSHKFIIKSKKSKISFLIKILPNISVVWDNLNRKFNKNMKNGIPSRKNAINNIYNIFNNKHLSKYTLLSRVNMAKYEYWQKYVTIDENQELDNSMKIRFNQIINEFKNQGYESFDHNQENYIIYNSKIYIIDLESFSFKKNNDSSNFKRST